jgi:hypothetical protein
MKFIPNPFPQKLHFLSSLGILYQHPVSIGKHIFDVRTFGLYGLYRVCVNIFEVIVRHLMNRYKKPKILNIEVFCENISKHDFHFSSVSIMWHGGHIFVTRLVRKRRKNRKVLCHFAPCIWFAVFENVFLYRLSC